MDKLHMLNQLEDNKIDKEKRNNIQHNLNKKTAKERILTILDKGSFVEVGTLLNKNGAGIVGGHGTINGRLVYIYSEDYRVNGGAFNKFAAKKICDLMDCAVKTGAPIIKIFDSIGGKVNEGIELLAYYGNILKKSSKLSGVVPQISIISGPCNGTMAVNASISDFVIVVNEKGSLAVNISETLEKEEEVYIDDFMYCKGQIVVDNNNAQFQVDTEEEAYKIVKDIFQYIPSNNLEMPYLTSECNNLNIENDLLNELALNDNLNNIDLIKNISDEGYLLEINKHIDKTIETYFVKLNGLTIGAICSNLKKENSLNIRLANKISSFVKLCDSFNIPILSVVNNKGFIASLDEEKNGLVNSIGKMVYTLADSNIPKISLVVGEAYGSGYLSLASKETAFDVALAWPTAKIALIEPEKLAKENHIDEILNSEVPSIKEKEIIDYYKDDFSDPYVAAEVGLIDDIIKPSETKQILFAMFDMLQTKRELNYPKKHGSKLL